MAKWKRDEKVLVGGLAMIATLALGSLVAVVINCATAVETGREAPAVVSYQYCAQWQAAYKSQTCARYATGHEKRIVIHKQGSLWNYDTYEVVR